MTVEELDIIVQAHIEGAVKEFQKLVPEVKKQVQNITKELNITYKIDNSDKSPGFKFAEAEVQGIPLRIEVGLRDIENNEVTMVRRDTLEKYKVKINEVQDKIKILLEEIQTNMYNKALERRNQMLYTANNKEEFLTYVNKPGFVKINWCGKEECENYIKDNYGLKSRCILENEEATGNCPICDKPAKYKIYFGKQY